MELIWKADEVIRAVNGKSPQKSDWFATGVSIDSRTTTRGDLFIAIAGPQNDGHNFVEKAAEAGATAAIVHKTPQSTNPDFPLIFVEDTFSALQDLGRVGRMRSKAKIIAVTGSVGKTGTKEMLRLILQKSGDTHANEGSLNNHWGVPLSLARLPENASFGVFEIGMNHAGELGPLSREVSPHVSLITNVEAVHLEFFDSVEAIADAKAEIFLGMNAEGIAVLNRDNPHYARLAAAAMTQGIRQILCFGKSEKSDARLIKLQTFEGLCEVECEFFGEKLLYRLGALGEHYAINSLAALLSASAAGANIHKGLEALASFHPPQGRGARHFIEIGEDKTITVIDESYNASPASMRKAISLLGQTPKNQEGRRIAVLGDMKELGESAPSLHRSLVENIEQSSIDIVHCCGEMMSHLYQALPSEKRGTLTENSLELAKNLIKDLRNGDVFMIKGSHSMRMDLIVEALLSMSKERKQRES